MSGDDQSKLTLMSESLRNDGRVWVPQKKGDTRPPDQIPDSERDYYLERRYPSFGNLVPRDVASRAAKQQSDEGFGVGDTGLSVYLDFKEAIGRLGVEIIKARYGNLFEMYERITAEDPYKVPMRIYPAIHYTMGGLWVDYNLESTIPGLFVHGGSELLRSRRESSRGERAHAGSGRRLLHRTVHRRQLPRQREAANAVASIMTPSKRRRVRPSSGSMQCCESKASAPSGNSTGSLATSCGITSGWHATKRG